jgi:NADPH-dependent ferric siderophore reductase
MLRPWLSRIGLAATLAGFAALGASLYMWTQAGHRLAYTERDEQWVRADSSSAPALERDETWQVSAACQRPYFVEAAAQAKAKLKAYSDTAPDEVRTWRNRAQETQEGWIESAASDKDVKLHAKYQDWFVAEFSLDKQLKQWERRLGALTDRSTSLREARERITDVRLYISEESGLAGAGRDFEHSFIFYSASAALPMSR